MNQVAQGMQSIKALGRYAAGFAAVSLFPPTCAGCRRQIAVPGALCAACWPKIRFLGPPWCEIMGTPFAHDLGQGILSAEAIADPPPFARARAAVAYSGVARELAQSLKYRDRVDLARWMADWMMRAGSQLIVETDVIVPVPLHWTRFLSRRFNQSAELGRAIAAQAAKRYEPEALTRVKATRRQVGLRVEQRRSNVRAAFKVPTTSEIDISGRRVLLIDDVYTTGATVRAAAKALLRGGAAEVNVLTFARVLPGDFRPDESVPI